MLKEIYLKYSERPFVYGDICIDPQYATHGAHNREKVPLFPLRFRFGVGQM